jgi:hypothetical protein
VVAVTALAGALARLDHKVDAAAGIKAAMDTIAKGRG